MTRWLTAWVSLGVACTASIGDPAESGPPPEPVPHALRPPPAGLRTLTPTQYAASVRTVLALEPTEVAPEVGQWATSVAAARGGLSPTMVDTYESTSRELVAYVFADDTRRGRIVHCAPNAAIDDACVREVLTRVGRRAYRRPLTEEELARWGNVVVTVAALFEGDAMKGLEHTITGLLQSTSFLYRVELGESEVARDGEADDAPGDSENARLRYTGHELVTRLAYLVWNAPPDDALLDLAEAQDLTRPAALDALLDMLLADPRAEAGATAFFADLFEADALRELEKNEELYPDFADRRASLAPQLVRVAREAVVEGGLPGLFTSRTVFVDAALAPYYGLDPASFGPSLDEGFERHELAEDDPRRGVLTTPGVLAMHAYPGSTSPALRGLFVRRRLLCQTIPPPPPNVSTQLPEMEEGVLMTTRDLVALHQRDPSCASCHAFIDPIGLALEHFEADGSHRADHHGLTIDPSGELDGAPFADASELGDRLAEHPSFLPCVAAQLYAFGAGGTVPAGHGDVRALAQADFPELVRALARSELFRTAWALEETP